jgi:nicotinate-nucleotide adenylyltransferase
LQIFFIIGADAFAEITTWHRYPEVLDRAHFVVVTRPGTALENLRTRLSELAVRITEADRFASAEAPRIILLHANTPDVSATQIRRQVAAGQSVAGLVPETVSAYIDRNSLYRSESHVPGKPGAPLSPGV